MNAAFLRFWQRVSLPGALALYLLGCVLYTFVYQHELIAAMVIMGAVVTGFKLGDLISFGRDFAVVRVLCGLIFGIVGSIGGMVYLELIVNPPEATPAPIAVSDPAEMAELEEAIEAVSSARPVQFAGILRYQARPVPDVEARIREIIAPHVCPKPDCADQLLFEARVPGAADAIQIRLRHLDVVERAKLQQRLDPVATRVAAPPSGE